MLIDNEMLDSLTARAQASPRLRMNLNFHQSLDEKCHRFLNAVEPGANIPIHRHPEKEESFVVLCCVAGYVSSPTTTMAPSSKTWFLTHRKAATA